MTNYLNGVSNICNNNGILQVPLRLVNTTGNIKCKYHDDTPCNKYSTICCN